MSTVWHFVASYGGQTAHEIMSFKTLEEAAKRLATWEPWPDEFPSSNVEDIIRICNKWKRIRFDHCHVDQDGTEYMDDGATLCKMEDPCAGQSTTGRDRH